MPLKDEFAKGHTTEIWHDWVLVVIGMALLLVLALEVAGLEAAPIIKGIQQIRLAQHLELAETHAATRAIDDALQLTTHDVTQTTPEAFRHTHLIILDQVTNHANEGLLGQQVLVVVLDLASGLETRRSTTAPTMRQSNLGHFYTLDTCRFLLTCHRSTSMSFSASHVGINGCRSSLGVWIMSL